MTAPRVLVVYKRTAFQRNRDSKRVKALLASDDLSVARMMGAHEAHLETIATAKRVLKELGAKATFRHKQTSEAEDVDLVVTLGGDGTVLWVSHFVDKDTPMVAINSSPTTSVGYFCAGTPDTMAETLSAALERKLKKTKLSRMEVTIDDTVVTTRVLNDVLFCHENPAMTTRYILRQGDVVEEQTSSGMWVGPAAGSTAAQRSAGGKVLPLGSKKLQFVVRELYRREEVDYSLDKGLIGPEDALIIKSKIRAGRLFIDGAQRNEKVDIGSVIRLRRSSESLMLLGLRRR